MACGNNFSCNSQDSQSYFLKPSATSIATCILGGGLISSLASCKDEMAKTLTGKKIPLLDAKGNLKYVKTCLLFIENRIYEIN